MEGGGEGGGDGGWLITAAHRSSAISSIGQRKHLQILTHLPWLHRKMRSRITPAGAMTQ